MHNSSAPPLRIIPGFSNWIAIYLLLIHFSALILILFIDLNIYLLIPSATLIISSLIYHWRKDVLHLEANSVIGIYWEPKSGWMVEMIDGDRLRVELCPTSFTNRYVVILHFKTTVRGRCRVTIPRDAIDSDQFRRLKVMLKVGNHFGR